MVEFKRWWLAYKIISTIESLLIGHCLDSKEYSFLSNSAQYSLKTIRFWIYILRVEHLGAMCVKLKRETEATLFFYIVYSFWILRKASISILGVVLRIPKEYPSVNVLVTPPVIKDYEKLLARKRPLELLLPIFWCPKNVGLTPSKHRELLFSCISKPAKMADRIANNGMCNFTHHQPLAPRIFDGSNFIPPLKQNTFLEAPLCGYLPLK